MVKAWYSRKSLVGKQVRDVDFVGGVGAGGKELLNRTG